MIINITELSLPLVTTTEIGYCVWKRGNIYSKSIQWWIKMGRGESSDDSSLGCWDKRGYKNKKKRHIWKLAFKRFSCLKKTKKKLRENKEQCFVIKNS